MRLLSWNLGKRPTRTDAVLEFLDTRHVDLALLQESRVHAGAEQKGWRVIRAARSPSDCVILSRRELDVRPAEPGPLKRLGSYVAFGELFVGPLTVALASVHPLAKVVPLSKLQGFAIDVDRPTDPRVWESDLFLSLVNERCADRPALVAGDWNTGELFPESLFARARALGWHEVLPPFHEGRQPRTWFRGNDRPHGLDHIFCTTDLVPGITAAFVDTTVVDSAENHAGKGLSDHAPVLMDIEFESQSD